VNWATGMLDIGERLCLLLQTGAQRCTTLPPHTWPAVAGPGALAGRRFHLPPFAPALCGGAAATGGNPLARLRCLRCTTALPRTAKHTAADQRSAALSRSLRRRRSTAEQTAGGRDMNARRRSLYYLSYQPSLAFDATTAV